MHDADVPEPSPAAIPARRQPNADAATSLTMTAGSPPGFADAMVVVGRVIASRVNDPHERQDIEQETAVRILERGPALDPDAAIAYGIVTARNLIVSRSRRETVAGRAFTRVIDLRSPENPLDNAVIEEERAAILAALAALPQTDRDALIAHEINEIPVAEIGRRESRSPGAIAVSLAAARAKLRVQFLLEHRQIALPTDRCRSILDAISANDSRRRHQLRADDHLAGCETCRALADPLLRRRRREPMLLLPFVAIWRLAIKLRHVVREHSVVAVAAGALIVAIALGVLVTKTQSADQGSAQPASATSAPGTTTAVTAPSSPPVTAAPSTNPAATITVPPATTPTIAANPPPLILGDAPFLPRPPGSLVALIGQPVRANRVLVLSVPTDHGFWVGTDQYNRVWAHFEHPEQLLEAIQPGQHLTFTGTLTSHPANYATNVGVSDPEDIAQLRIDAAHITAQAEGLSIE